MIFMKKSNLLLMCLILSMGIATAQVNKPLPTPKPIPKPLPTPVPKPKISDFVFGTIMSQKTGRPAEHVLVAAQGTTVTPANEHGHYTNVSGFFKFDVVAGTTTLVVTPDGNEYDALEVPAIKGIDVFLLPKSIVPVPGPNINRVKISGTVTDDQEHAVSGARVKVHGIPEGETTTDANGKFSFYVPVNAKYLIVNANGFLDKGVQLVYYHASEFTSGLTMHVWLKTYMIYKQEHVMRIGDQEGLETMPSDGVTWKSSNPAVATVERVTDGSRSAGLVKAVSAGNAVISATRNGKTEYCKITVKP